MDSDLKDRLKERYYQETGEDLPDHVVENIELIANYPPPHKLREHIKKRAEQKAEQQSADVVDKVLLLTIVFGTGLWSLYVTRWIPGEWSKVVGGLLIWPLSCGLLVFALAVISEWQD